MLPLTAIQLANNDTERRQVMGERQKRYGHGRWPRKQLYAIVASYRSLGRRPEWIAAKLGVGPRIVEQICEYLDQTQLGGAEPLYERSECAAHRDRSV